MLNLETFDIEDLQEALINEGYEVNEDDLYNVKHISYQSYFHSFLVIVYNDNEDGYDVTDVYVFLNKDGELGAEFPGMPRQSFSDYEDAVNFYNRIGKQ
jgi:hypothetical protein